jgi:DNA-directed RNA polymerase specialized sigma24 family protein
MPQANHITKPTPYASSGDFHRIFDEDTDSLYRLAFLLTANREKADQCVVFGLEDSVKGNPVFKEWARSWARRAIIQNAQRMINPRPVEEGYPSSVNVGGRTSGQRQAETTAILNLAPFDRFVYVMSFLEHYSDHECSILLGCSRRDVIAARSRALEQVVNVGVHLEQIDPGPEEPESHDNCRSLLEDLLHV